MKYQPIQTVASCSTAVTEHRRALPRSLLRAVRTLLRNLRRKRADIALQLDASRPQAVALSKRKKSLFSSFSFFFFNSKL